MIFRDEKKMILIEILLQRVDGFPITVLSRYLGLVGAHCCGLCLISVVLGYL